MRAIGYARISVENDEGQSLQAQTARIRAYMKAQAWEEIGIEQDTQSGKNMDRTGLQKCLHLLKTHKADALCIVRLDRVTRSLQDLLHLLELSQRQKWALVSLSEAWDTSTPTGRLLVSVIGSIAEFERRQIGQRTKDALAHLRRTNRPCGSVAPYGWRKKGKTLKPVPEEQKAVKAILRYKRQGLSYGAIADRMNGTDHTPRGECWRSGQVWKIIRRASTPT